MNLEEVYPMKIMFFTILLALFGVSAGFGQKGKANPDFYPLGYSGEIWTGEVIEFNNELRTLTLSDKKGKNAETFIAVIPDAPCQWGKDIYRYRVLDFAFDKKVKVGTYKYEGFEYFSNILPRDIRNDTQRRINPSGSNVLSEFAQFKGRKITVFYSQATRLVKGQKEKYNDVWRIRILKK